MCDYSRHLFTRFRLILLHPSIFWLLNDKSDIFWQFSKAYCNFLDSYSPSREQLFSCKCRFETWETWQWAAEQQFFCNYFRQGTLNRIVTSGPVHYHMFLMFHVSCKADFDLQFRNAYCTCTLKTCFSTDYLILVYKVKGFCHMLIEVQFSLKSVYLFLRYPVQVCVLTGSRWDVCRAPASMKSSGSHTL